MIVLKQIGIWMDHANAHLIEPGTGSNELVTIQSDLMKEGAITAEKGQKSLHNKQQQHETAYYKKLAAVILQYRHVLLFGPTDAKQELFNYLKRDHHFDQINIEVIHADKMTVNQQKAFVVEHFSKGQSMLATAKAAERKKGKLPHPVADAALTEDTYAYVPADDISKNLEQVEKAELEDAGEEKTPGDKQADNVETGKQFPKNEPGKPAVNMHGDHEMTGVTDQDGSTGLDPDNNSKFEEREGA